MSENWTPGPWIVDDRSSKPRILTGASPNYLIAAGPICGGSAARRTAEANGRLIAAAPELYAALEEVVRISDRKHDAWDEAKAALAKARGEA